MLRIDGGHQRDWQAGWGAMMYTFTINGRIKPYVRMTQRGKWASPQAREYLASQDEIRWELMRQKAAGCWDMLPARIPLNVSLVFTFPGGWHNADLDNQIKACLDAANGIVWHDDRWIDSLYGARKAGDDYVCTLRVQVARVDTVDEALAAGGGDMTARWDEPTVWIGPGWKCYHKIHLSRSKVMRRALRTVCGKDVPRQGMPLSEAVHTWGARPCRICFPEFRPEKPKKSYKQITQERREFGAYAENQRRQPDVR